MISPVAARIYMLGETRYAEGRYDEAVALWGHTLLQLPEHAAADEIRHKLITRMGHGLLKAYGATGDTSYLVDGQQMCELYAAKHEDLFGDTDDARAQRGEIYELLYEFDTRLDTEQEPVVSDEDEPSAAPTEVLAAPSSAEDSSSDESDDEADEIRIVNVKRFAWADPNDPRVRAYLHDARFLGPSMVDNGGEHLNESRVLVRVGQIPRPTNDGDSRRAARRAGLAVVDAARPELERCYERAMSRDPVLAARVEVSLTVHADGSVHQPLLGGDSLVDGEGDACVAQVLRDTHIDSAAVDGAIAVSMPIQFFFQDTQAVANIIRIERPGTNGTSRGYSRTGGASGLPPIDAFVGSRPRSHPGAMFLDPDQQEQHGQR